MQPDAAFATDLFAALWLPGNRPLAHRMALMTAYRHVLAGGKRVSPELLRQAARVVRL